MLPGEQYRIVTIISFNDVVTGLSQRGCNAEKNQPVIVTDQKRA
jgi:hypothetical protein